MLVRGASVIRHVGPLVLDITLWILNLSAALFIGQEGDVRIGSGCKSGQTVRATCSGRGPHIMQCTFHRETDNGGRIYLAMGQNTSLETLFVKGSPSQQESLLKRASTMGNLYHRLETMFLMHNITDREDCQLNTDCYTIRLLSSENPHYINIRGSEHHNIRKLHIKALTSKSKVLDDVNKTPCMRDPGPFRQQIHPEVGMAFKWVYGNEQPPKGCRQETFTNSICQGGRLKESYPISNTLPC